MSGFSGKAAKHQEEKSGALKEKLARCPDWAASCESEDVPRAAWFADLQMGWMRNAPGIIEVVTPTPFIARWLCGRYLHQIASAARKQYADVSGVIIYPAGADSAERSIWADNCGLKSKAKMADTAEARAAGLKALKIASLAQPRPRDAEGCIIDDAGNRVVGRPW